MAAGSCSSFQSLPDSSKRLIQLAQTVNFGRASFFVASRGPDLTRPVKIVRMVRLNGGENGPRCEAGRGDFVIRKEVRALLDQLAAVPDGAVVTVKIEHGLPVHVEIAEEHMA